MSRSDYFRAMLGGPWVEGGKVTLEGVDVALVHQMLVYMYSGSLHLLPGTIWLHLARYRPVAQAAGWLHLVDRYLPVALGVTYPCLAGFTS